MEYFILISLIVLNGAFAMSEIALVTASKGRLLKLAADGDSAAASALQLGEDPTRFLSTVQIGITSIGILNGIIGEAALARPLSLWLEALGVAQETASIGATALVVVVVTYVSIVIGELVPKRLGQINPEKIARLVARPMLLLALITRPFVRFLAFSTDTILRLAGMRHIANPNFAQDEIHALLAEGSEAGQIEPQQHDMVRNVFRLDHRKVGSLMIPRTDIVYLDTTLSLEENRRQLLTSNLSRFPVCEGGLRNLLGIIRTKQLLDDILRGEPLNLTDHLQSCLFVPDALNGTDLLESFRANHVDIAFVVDEYGEVEGLVTLQSLLEAVTGEFKPLNAEEARSIQREDGSWLLDGIIPIPELKDCLALKSLPEEAKGHYHTLSGLMMGLLERLPHTGDYVDWEGWRFEVVDMDERRIDKVLATPLALPAMQEITEKHDE
jgi:putative hemolysin